MSALVIEKTKPQVAHSNGTPPILEAGDYLTRPEFERRYHAHPELKKAELIEGIVSALVVFAIPELRQSDRAASIY